jgi:hypothetical protein
MEAVLNYGRGHQKWLKSCMGSVWMGWGRSLPSANPDNVAADGATDARCGEGGKLEEGGEGWHEADNSS